MFQHESSQSLCSSFFSFQISHFKCFLMKERYFKANAEADEKDTSEQPHGDRKQSSAVQILTVFSLHLCTACQSRYEAGVMVEKKLPHN